VTAASVSFATAVGLPAATFWAARVSATCAGEVAAEDAGRREVDADTADEPDCETARDEVDVDTAGEPGGDVLEGVCSDALDDADGDALGEPDDPD
jgi:hypothetical protein